MQQDIFQKFANEWWDPKGTFKPLHMMNPLRIQFIVDHVKAHFQRETIEKLKILDIGCGGGLICEPLARLGAHVTGIDLSKEAIEVAKAHAAEQELSITYLNQPLESLEEKFDVIVASEVIEHIDDPQNFVKEIAKHLKPNGCFVITTLNRTLKSKILGIWVAENIINWAPKGAHQHEMFIKPSELYEMCEPADLKMTEITGVIFNPLRCAFEFSKDMDINYFAFGIKL